MSKARSDLPGEEGVTGVDFAALYEQHAERVLIYLARRCLDPDVAVDLMAETFAQAFANRRRLRGRTEGEAAAWVFGIARHQLADYFRRGKAERRAVGRLGVRVPALDVDEQVRIEELADLENVRKAVAEHFHELSEEQREALRLRVIHELPYSEVARCLCVSEDAARARVSRGLRHLAATLDQALLAKGAASYDRA